MGGNLSCCCQASKPAPDAQSRKSLKKAPSAEVVQPQTTVSPYVFSDDEDEVMVHGVSERSGAGDVPCPPSSSAQHVSRWLGQVWPARMDMDRFGVCVSEDGVIAAGIFDGHGTAGRASWGAEVAQSAARTICRGAMRWAANGDEDMSKLEDIFMDFQRKHEEQYDKTVGKEVEEARRRFVAEHGFSPGLRALPAEGGSTATVVTIKGDTLCAAWVGDSRAVLCRENEEEGSGSLVAVALTTDHNVATNKEECQRCEEAGGYFVMGRFVGSNFADGMLQVTRSLGDRPHHYGSILISQPEIRTLKLTPQDAFLVVASDGIWETIPEMEVLTIIHSAISRTGDVQAAADEVIQRCREDVDKYGLKKDDCSMVVLTFHRPNLRHNNNSYS